MAVDTTSLLENQGQAEALLHILRRRIVWGNSWYPQAPDPVQAQECYEGAEVPPVRCGVLNLHETYHQASGGLEHVREKCCPVAGDTTVSCASHRVPLGGADLACLLQHITFSLDRSV